MYFKCVDMVYDPDSDGNADWIAQRPDALLWLDGAAPFDAQRLFNYPCDAAWFVRRFAEVFFPVLQTPVRTTDAINKAIEITAADYEEALASAACKPTERPFACLGVARIVDNCLEVVNAGDCSAFIEFKDGRVTRFGHSAVADLDRRALSDMQALRGPNNELHRASFARVKARILANRAMRNTMFGYEVIEPVLPADVQVERMLLPLDRVQSILIASDGFCRACDNYDLFSIDQASAIVRQVGLVRLAAWIRDVERADGEAVRFPRLKISDDIAAAYVEISA